MLAGENSINNSQNASSDAKKGGGDHASADLADSSLNEAPALGGAPAQEPGINGAGRS